MRQTACFLLSSFFLINVSAKEIDRIYTVGFAQDTMSNDWRAAQVNEMKDSLSRYSFIKFIYTDAKGKPFQQTLDLQLMDKKGADILVTSPRDHRVMTPIINALSKKKPVILLTRKILNDEFTAFVGANDYLIAQNAAKLIKEKLNGKGKVVMLKGVSTATTAKAREKGFLDQLSKYPEIQVVAAPVADYRRHKAITAMEKILKEGVEFNAIFAHSDSMASGARIAMEHAGLNPADYIIVGIDYIPEARDAIKAGKQTASFTYPTASKQGADIILQLIRGEKIKKYTEVPSILVTTDNVDSVNTIFK